MKQILKITLKRFCLFCLRVLLRLARRYPASGLYKEEVETHTSKSKRVRKESSHD